MKKLIAIFLTLTLVLTFMPTFSLADTTGTLIIYPEYPEELNRDYDYEVTVSAGGKTETIPVYNPSRLKNSFNSAKDTDSWRRFCEFAFEGEVTVSVKTKLQVSSYSVLPSSKGISSTFNTDTITFTLTQPENIVVRLNDDQNTVLCIFAEAPYEEFDYQAEIASGRNVIYFGAGYNNLDLSKTTVSFGESVHGQIRIPINTTLYLAPGALVSRRLIAKNDNVKIIGRGAIIDPRLDRATSGESHMILATNDAGGGQVFDEMCDNFTIDGVRLLDAYCFNIDLTNVNGASITNAKVLSNEISTDGVTIRNGCKNITVDNCFFYVNDNNIVVTEANENILVQNCIFGSNHALLYPQGKTTKFTAQNIDVFRMGNFFSVKEPTANNGSWNVTATNIRAADALKMSNVIYAQIQGDQNSGVATFTNVSLPETNATAQFNYAKGFTFNFNNVYIGSNKVDAKSDIAVSEVWYTNCYTFNFGSTFDSALAGVGVNRQTASFAGQTPVKVGGYSVPFDKNLIQTINDVTYYPANNLLTTLGYEVNENKNTLKITDQNGVITLTQNSANVYGLDTTLTNNAKVVNGKFMLPASFLREVLGLTVSGATVTAQYNGQNLVSDPSFENIHNYDIPAGEKYAKSTAWTHFYFGGLFEHTDESHTGATSLKLNIKNAQSGLAQYLSDEIQKYGAGTYRLECYAKVYDSDLSTTALETNSLNVELGIVQAGFKIREDDALIGINDVKAHTLTSDWQKISYEVVITNPTADGYDRAFFYLGGTFDNGAAILVDSVNVTFAQTVSNKSELTSLLNKNLPTRKGEIFKGYVDNNGNLYTTSSNVSSAVKLYPEFVFVGNAMSDSVEKGKTFLVGETYRLLSEYRLGVHRYVDGVLDANIMDSQGDQSVEAHSNLKNGKMVLPYATTYYSQARFYDNGWKENGIWFKPFTVSSAPNGYTPKTVYLYYNEAEKIYTVPKNVTLYVGDTLLFDMHNTLETPTPYPKAQSISTVCTCKAFRCELALTQPQVFAL